MQQAGALPYRIADDGSVEVLLITSRRSRAWIFPKGHVDWGETPATTAAKEAGEEAGIYGTVDDRGIGSYADSKQGLFGFVRRFEVILFPLAFAGYLPVWQEEGLRERRWAGVDEAAALVSNRGIRDVLMLFAARTDLR